MTEILKVSLHTISQWLLIPTMAILIALIVVTVAALGSVIVEAVTERFVVKENIVKLIMNMHGKTINDMRSLISESKIYKRHKEILFTLLENKDMPEELLVAASRRMLSTEDAIFDRRASKVEVVSRIAPMFGLMGTLIPLGPGLMALGQGNTNILADSLLIAFDTTIAGLISAAVCYVIARIRRRWYDDYMVSLETIMDTILEEVTADENKLDEV